MPASQYWTWLYGVAGGFSLMRISHSEPFDNWFFLPRPQGSRAVLFFFSFLLGSQRGPPQPQHFSWMRVPRNLSILIFFLFPGSHGASSSSCPRSFFSLASPGADLCPKFRVERDCFDRHVPSPLLFPTEPAAPGVRPHGDFPAGIAGCFTAALSPHKRAGSHS